MPPVHLNQENQEDEPDKSICIRRIPGHEAI